MGEIPKDAEKVFEGVIFDVYQWDQEENGHELRYEMLDRPDTVRVLPLVGEKIVLGKESRLQRGERWGMLGGRRDDGESPLESGKRELLEESGLASDDWELYRSFEPYHRLDWTVYVFIARDCEKVAEPDLEPGEEIEVHKMNFDEFSEKVMSAKFMESEMTQEFLLAEREGRMGEVRGEILG